MTNCLVFLKNLSKFNVKYLDLLHMKFLNLYFHILGTNVINYQKRKIKINSLNDILKDFNIDFIIVNVDDSYILKTSDLFNNLKFIKIVNCFSNIPLKLAKQTENSLYFHNNCDLNYILKTVDGLKLNLKNTQNKNNIVSKELEDFSNLCLSYSNKQINVRNKSIKRKGIYEAVYIEFRSLKHSEFIIKNCVIKLHDKWSHTVICCNDNYNYTVDLCSRINKNINIIKLDITNATYNDYNNLLLSKEFWKMLNGEKILIYQSDSLIYNSNIDDFLKYDYIGMPFLNKHYILSPSSVGNGGLSLRSKKTMLDVLNNPNCNKKCSNIAEHFRLQHKFDNIPEDIFFSQNIQNLKLGLVPDDNVGKLFASSDNINCFGMHAIWKYNKSWKPLIVEFMKKKYSTNFQKADLGKVAHFDTAKHLSTETICNENAFGMYSVWNVLKDWKNSKEINNSHGFIILRHVKCELTNNYWIRCYKSIRSFYPENKIIIIDDNSDYRFITVLEMYNTEIINAEHKKHGEFLPYIYYLNNKWFENAIILHDSVFINRAINFDNDKTYKFLWFFNGQINIFIMIMI